MPNMDTSPRHQLPQDQLPQQQLPSARTLLRSTVIAAAVAAALLVTVVLPAEYGVDPTRIGRLLGLTRMGEIKMALAKEAATADSIEAAAIAAGTTDSVTSRTRAAPAASPATDATGSSTPRASGADSSSSDTTQIVLRPNEGKEIKLAMRKDARVTYSWSTDRGVVNYDTHADAPGIRYHGYGKGTSEQSDEGVLVAAFDGMHGWFWRNRGREVVTVTLRTSGDYQEIKQTQ